MQQPISSSANERSGQRPKPELGRHWPILSLRWRKAWRDLIDDRLRTLLVVLSMAIGLFAFGAIIGARGILSRELIRSFLATHPASIRIDTEPFSGELVAAARRWPGVARANGRREIPVRVRIGPEDWNDLHLIVIEDFSDLQVNVILPESGPWPPPRHSLLIERRSPFLFSTDVGRTLDLTLPDGRERSIAISGTVHDMNQPPAQVFGIGFGYISLETAAWLGLPTTFNQLQIRVDGDTTDVAHIQAVASFVERKLKDGGRAVHQVEIPNPDSHFAFDFLPALTYLMTALGVLSLLLSSLLIINVLLAILKKHVRQIGIMKTIGGRQRTIAAIYFRMVGLLGAAAVALALPFSLIAAYFMAGFVAGELNFDIENRFVEPVVLGAMGVVGLLLPLLVAFFPIFSASGQTVHRALTDTGLGDLLSEGPLSRSRLVRRLPRPVRLSLRNTFRRRGRLALTLVTLGMAGGVFISVMTLRVSLFATLEETLRARGYDLQIRFGRLYQAENMEKLLLGLPGVTAVESWRVVPAVPRRPSGSDGETLFVNGLPADTRLFHPEMSAGRWLAPEDTRAAVVHNNLLSKEPFLSVGSPLTLIIGSEETTWEIVGITHELQPPIGPTNVYVNYPALARILGGSRMTDSVQVELNRHDRATQITQQQVTEKVLTENNVRVTSSRTAADDREVFTERFNILTIVLTSMSMIIAGVGSLGLTGSLTISVMERRREIGVMRAIGGSDRAVLQIFLIEGMIIGALSWGFALLLSQPISRLMAYQLGIIFLGVPLNYLFATWGAFLWLAIAMVLSFLASLLPSQKATRLKIREVLAYE